MTFWTFLQTIFGYLPTSIVKSSNAKSVGENIRAEASEIVASAPNASESKHSSEVRWMTKTEAKTRLVDWCKSQIGYHEGYDGTNKYGADGDWDTRLYGFESSNVAWCDVFVDYAFIHVFGYDEGTTMTYQNPSGYAACSLSAQAYKDHGAFFSDPEVGDQIFFIYGGGINHTGIVISVEGDTVVCVEGNYSDSVALTEYRWKGMREFIAGFGRPNWAVVAEPETIDTDEPLVDDGDEMPQFDIVHPEHRRTFMHIQYGDGVGNPKPQIKAWQNLLLCWGIDIGESGADGEYGDETEKATKAWQRMAKDIGADVEVNGIVDQDDWKAIINVPGGD